MPLEEEGSRPVTRSWRTHCEACGSKKEKRWGEGRLTLTKFCPNEACSLHGIPNMVAVKVVVTFDRLGRRHVAHKEAAVHRRPRFQAPAPAEPPPAPVSPPRFGDPSATPA